MTACKEEEQSMSGLLEGTSSAIKDLLTLLRGWSDCRCWAAAQPLLRNCRRH